MTSICTRNLILTLHQQGPSVLSRALPIVSKCRSYSFKRRDHPYYSCHSWDNIQHLTETLLQNVILNEDGLVIINKPYGIGIRRPIKEETTNVTPHFINTAFVGKNVFYLNESAPYLAEALGYSNLNIVKAPERYSSGIAILSANEEVTSKVKSSIQKAKGRQYLTNTYWILVLGSPQPHTSSEKLGLKLEKSPVCDDKQPILVQDWSKHSMQRREVYPCKVEYKVLKEGPFASLVELHPSRTKWHFLRVYMAHILSPILGDNLYGSRVHNVFGIPMSISPFSDRTKLPKKLSKQLLSSLLLKAGEEVVIPTHIHLQQVILPDYKGKGTPLKVQAPLPDVFAWTCKQLSIQKSEDLQTYAVSHTL